MGSARAHTAYKPRKGRKTIVPLFRWFSKMILERILAFTFYIYVQWGKTLTCVGLNSEKGTPECDFIEPKNPPY